MTTLKCKTNVKKANSATVRIYFSCHPDDLFKALDTVCGSIHKKHKCEIYFKEDMADRLCEEDCEKYLSKMDIFVFNVTQKMLDDKNNAIHDEVVFAKNKRKPIIPIVQNSDIKAIKAEHNLSEMFGSDILIEQHDNSMKMFDNSINNVLNALYLNGDTAEKIKKIFDAYIFYIIRKTIPSLSKFMLPDIRCDEFTYKFAEKYYYLEPDCSFISFLNVVFLSSDMAKEILGFEYTKYKTMKMLPGGRDNYYAFLFMFKKIAKIMAHQRNNAGDLHDFTVGYAELMFEHNPAKDYSSSIELITAAAENNKTYAAEFLHSLYHGDIFDEYKSKEKTIYWSSRLYRYNADYYGENSEIAIYAFVDYLSCCSITSHSEPDKYLQKINKYYRIFRENEKEYAMVCILSLLNMEVYYLDKEDYDKLDWIYIEMLGTIKRRLGEKSSMYANTLRKIANNQLNLEKYADAMQNIKKSREIYSEIEDAEEEEILDCIMLYGHICRLNNENEEAISALEGIYPDICRAFGEKSYCAMDVNYDLGKLYMDLENPEKAMEHMQKYYDISMEKYGEKSSRVSDARHIIADIHFMNKEWDQAIELEKQRYNVFIEKDEKDEYLILGSQQAIAVNYYKKGDNKKAFELITEVYNRAKEVISKKSGLYFDILLLLSMVYFDEGNYEASLLIMAEYYDLCCEKYGAESLSAMESASVLAEIYDQLENKDKALEYGKMCYKYYYDNFGEDDPRTLDINRLIIYNSGLDSYEENKRSKENFEKLYNAYLKQYGEHNFNTIKAKIKFSYYYAKEDAAKALSMCLEAYDELVGEYSEKTEFILSTNTTLAFIYRKNGDNFKALELIEETYKKKCELFGEDSPNTMGSLRDYIEYYGWANEFDEEVINLQKEYYMKVCNMYGTNSTTAISALNRLALYYYYANDYEKSLECYEKGLKQQYLKYGKENYEILDTMYYIVLVLKESDELEKAYEFCEGYYELCCKIYGKEHENTKEAYEELESIRKLMEGIS